MTALATGPVAGVPVKVPGRRRWTVWWAPLAVAGVLTVLITLALAGAALDDAGIDARTGRATAQVLAVTPMRTLVQFTVPEGRVYRPDQGVAYSSGLAVGQLVRVEYDTADPDQVRVAGRAWTQAVRPAALTLAALWLVLGPVSWGLRRRPVGSSSSTANPALSCSQRPPTLLYRASGLNQGPGKGEPSCTAQRDGAS